MFKATQFCHFCGY